MPQLLSSSRCILFFAIASQVVGCASTAPSQTKGPKAQIEIVTKPLQETPELQGLKVELPWELQNPTAAAATVEAIAWTFQVGDQQPVKGVEPIGLRSEPKTSDAYTTGFEIPLATNLESLHSENHNQLWKYRLTAVFQIKSHLGIEEIEAEWNGELFPPQPPKVSVYAEGARYSSGVYELNFFVTIENPNSFELNLDGINYKLNVDGTEINTGTLGSKRSMQPGVGLEFELSKTVGAQEFKDLAKRLRGRTSIPYLFNSDVIVAGSSFPNRIEAEINFDR